MIYTTLNKIRDQSPCGSGWVTLLEYLGKTKADDELLGFDVILDSNGLDDTLWCLRTLEKGNPVSRPFALWCARQVEHRTNDPRVKACNDVNERFMNGEATQAELDAAKGDADSATLAAGDTSKTRTARAAWAARSAARAASDAASAAASDAASDAAWAARSAAWAASDVARAAARAAMAAIDGAWAAARATQKTEFLRLITERG